jgi:hypothetical protein
MAFTRFHDDPCRIKKQLQESTDIGRYMLNTPGNGDKPHYMNDPHIRLQKWGGNLMTNTVNLESDLRGLSRPISRDCMDINEYTRNSVKSNMISYPSMDKDVTDQPRSTHPAWYIRDLEQDHWDTLHLNPQDNVLLPFNNYLNTRIIEKDSFIAKTPYIANQN